METCENCRFLGVLVGTLDNYNQCRRHAPVLTEGSIVIGDCWPTVKLTDWCGEWSAKDEKEATDAEWPDGPRTIVSAPLSGRADGMSGRQAMKPIKPCKSWAVATGEGGLLNQLYHAKSQCPFVLTTDDRFVRVRVLEDAAVERAIAALRKYKANDDDVDATIRDLGGKP